MKHLLDTVAASDQSTIGKHTHSEHPHPRHRSRNSRHRRSNTANTNTTNTSRSTLASTQPSSEYNRVRLCKSYMDEHNKTAVVDVFSSPTDDKLAKTTQNSIMCKDQGNFSMTDSNTSMCLENHEVFNCVNVFRLLERGYSFLFYQCIYISYEYLIW